MAEAVAGIVAEAVLNQAAVVAIGTQAVNLAAQAEKAEAAWDGVVADGPAVLEIKSMNIPSAAMTTVDEGGKSTTFYEIQIEDGTGRAWSVKRRYNQFDTLARKLPAQVLSDRRNPFPHGFWRRSSERALEERRSQLEAWLKGVLDAQLRLPQVRQPIQEFLEWSAGGTGESGVSLQPAAAVAAKAITVFEIAIPDGVKEGEAMKVTCPDGGILDVTVPPGYGAGMTLQIVSKDDAHALPEDGDFQ